MEKQSTSRLLKLVVSALALFLLLACGVFFTACGEEEAHTHKYDKTDSKTVATCGSTGYDVYTCSCGDTYAIVTAATGKHNFADGHCTVCGISDAFDASELQTKLNQINSTVDGLPKSIPDVHKHDFKAVENSTVAPTCYAGGFTYAECACGSSAMTAVTQALGHNWKEDASLTKPATCTSAGMTYEKCEVCGETREKAAIPAAEHNWKEDEAKTVPATCTTTGKTYEKCEVCGITREGAVIEALGHKYPVNEEGSEEVTVVYATCMEGGYVLHTCEVCGYQFRSDLTKEKGHTWVDDKTVEATCTTPGYTTKRCLDCNTTFEDSVTPATGHKFVKTGEVPATCTTPGHEVEVCSNCNMQQEGKVIAALGHKFVKTGEVPATCTTPGHEVEVCSNCNMQQDGKTIEALGHDFIEEPVIIKVPTCAEEGLMTFRCKREGCKDQDGTAIIPATGHLNVVAASEAEVEGADAHKVAATYHKNAQEELYCKDCNAWTGEFKAIEGTSGEAKGVDHFSVMAFSYTAPATCQYNQYDVFTCAECGTWVQREVYDTKLDHNMIAREPISKGATCTEPGEIIESAKCEWCDYEVTSEAKVVEALGHNMEAGEITIKVEPTCTTVGERVQAFKCSRCDYSEEREYDPLPMKDHNVDATKEPVYLYVEVHTDWRLEDKDKDELWSAAGKKWNTKLFKVCVCEDCKQFVIKNEVAVADETTPTYEWKVLDEKEDVDRAQYEWHSWDKYDKIPEGETEPNVEATCNKEGWFWYACEDDTCRLIPLFVRVRQNALGHELDTESRKEVKKATCLEAGSYSFGCKNCDEIFTVELVDGTWTVKGDINFLSEEDMATVLECADEYKALGHKWGEWKYNEDATCAEIKVGTRVCEQCAEEQTVTLVDDVVTGVEDLTEEEIAVLKEALKATAHTWGEGTVTTEATCTEVGTMHFECTICSATKDEEIEALGHVSEWIKVEGECKETSVCARCEDVLEERVSHELSGKAWIEYAECGSGDANVKYDYCTECGEIVVLANAGKSRRHFPFDRDMIAALIEEIENVELEERIEMLDKYASVWNEIESWYNRQTATSYYFQVELMPYLVTMGKRDCMEGYSVLCFDCFSPLYSLPATQHSLVEETIVAAKAAEGCLTGGNLEYGRCEFCNNWVITSSGKLFTSEDDVKEAAKVAPRGHNFEYKEDLIPGDCERGAYAGWYCKDCYEVDEDGINFESFKPEDIATYFGVADGEEFIAYLGTLEAEDDCGRGIKYSVIAEKLGVEITEINANVILDMEDGKYVQGETAHEYADETIGCIAREFTIPAEDRKVGVNDRVAAGKAELAEDEEVGVDDDTMFTYTAEDGFATYCTVCGKLFEADGHEVRYYMYENVDGTLTLNKDKTYTYKEIEALQAAYIKENGNKPENYIYIYTNQYGVKLVTCLFQSFCANEGCENYKGIDRAHPDVIGNDDYIDFMANCQHGQVCYVCGYTRGTATEHKVEEIPQDLKELSAKKLEYFTALVEAYDAAETDEAKAAIFPVDPRSFEAIHEEDELAAGQTVSICFGCLEAYAKGVNITWSEDKNYSVETTEVPEHSFEQKDNAEEKTETTVLYVNGQPTENANYAEYGCDVELKQVTTTTIITKAVYEKCECGAEHEDNGKVLNTKEETVEEDIKPVTKHMLLPKLNYKSAGYTAAAEDGSHAAILVFECVACGWMTTVEHGTESLDFEFLTDKNGLRKETIEIATVEENEEGIPVATSTEYTLKIDGMKVYLVSEDEEGNEVLTMVGEVLADADYKEMPAVEKPETPVVPDENEGGENNEGGNDEENP